MNFNPNLTNTWCNLYHAVYSEEQVWCSKQTKMHASLGSFEQNFSSHCFKLSLVSPHGATKMHKDTQVVS